MSRVKGGVQDSLMALLLVFMIVRAPGGAKRPVCMHISCTVESGCYCKVTVNMRFNNNSMSVEQTNIII